MASIVSMEADRQRQTQAASSQPSETSIATSHETVTSAATDASLLAESRAETEAEASKDEDNNNDNTDTRLHIHAFFAASDMLIGPGGKTYFDACFTDIDATPTSPSNSTTSTRASTGEVRADTSKPRIDQSIRYESEVVPETNHETIVELLKGVVGRVFEEVVEGW